MKTTRKFFTVLLLAAYSAVHATEYHVAKTGSDSNPGTKDSPLRTIQRAADLAHPGDTITVHAGTYRERINPPRGGESEDRRIVYQAARGEHVEDQSHGVKAAKRKTAGMHPGASCPDRRQNVATSGAPCKGQVNDTQIRVGQALVKRAPEGRDDANDPFKLQCAEPGRTEVCAHAAGLSGDRFQHHFRMPRRDAQEHAGRARWLPAPLLPVLEGAHADPEHARKLGLAELELGANHRHGIGLDPIDARDDTLVAAEVGAGFADALKQGREAWGQVADFDIRTGRGGQTLGFSVSGWMKD